MIFTYTSPALWLCLISFACLRLTFCKLYLFLNRKPEESSTEIWQNLIKIGTSAFEGLCSNLESTFTHHKTPHTRAPQFHSLRKQKSEIRKQKTEHSTIAAFGTLYKDHRSTSASQSCVLISLIWLLTLNSD